MVTSAQLRSIDVLGALSLAGDMAMGLRAGHGVRATYIGMRIADRLGLTPAQRVDLFYAELLMDAGCTAWASQTAAAILSDDIAARRQFYFLSDPSDPRDLLRWLAGYMAAGERLDRRLRRSIDFAMHGREFMVEALRNTGETAARLARRLDRPPGVQEGLRFAFEQWDGGGPYERRADAIPLISRIVYATVFLEVIHQLSGREAALQLGRGRRGKTLDPTVVDAFLSVSTDSDFWPGLEDEAVWDVVCDMEPESPYRFVDPRNLDDAARAFADFADLKSFFTAGHSRRVADLSERLATSLGVAPEHVAEIRRAALLHDIGLVAVPSFVLHKPTSRLAVAEWETLRLHPYYSQRILARVPAFGAAGDLVASHHERPDGQGYPRGVRGEQIPLGARVLSVADAFDELTHDGPDGPGLEAGPSLQAVVREAGSRFDRDVVEALRKVLDVSAPALLAPPARHEWPAGLTDREVEVLRLLATGASRRDMAERLSVSEHTIRHHLEHIYTKLDVRTRVEATLFALEHNLIA
jgi:HD-GYP domain-containing protein (c-di-GMP phosphodiesterase class II)/DNA-binding CsgD family transcriptional regulator